MAEPNSPQPPVQALADRFTGQLAHLPPARPFLRPLLDRPLLDRPLLDRPLLDRPVLDRPLPDPVAIRQVAVPQTDPPYDPADDTATLDALELALAVPKDTESTTGTLTPPESPATVNADPATGAVPAGPAHFAERYSAGPWPSQFAQALAETLAGTRPQRQLAAWTSRQARRRISQLSPALATARPPKLKRVITTSPADGVLEMTVIVDLGPRVRALAVRLERSDLAAPPASGPANSNPANSGPAKPTRPGPTRSGPATPVRPTAPTASAASTGSAAPPRPRWRCTAIEVA